MKSTTSNWRPLLRAFYPFLIASAVLWAAPRNACAQLYLTNRPHFFLIGRVSEYNATTGEVVNANFITGLNLPTGIAVKGNTLFVANTASNTVGKYDATTGGAINPGFITGLNGPNGVAVKGNKLFVSNFNSGTVGKYNANTGEVINANFITGLNGPAQLALLGNRLFVANSGSNTVGKYNANTGGAINANFITGLDGPTGIAVKGNTLFVSNGAFIDFLVGNTVGKYNATTGEVINASFITGPNLPGFNSLVGLALLGNRLFVANSNLGGGPGAAFSDGTVGEYDATTGAAINANFITGLQAPFGLAVKSAK